VIDKNRFDMLIEFKELYKKCTPKEIGLKKHEVEKCFLSNVMRLDEFKEYCDYFSFDGNEKDAKGYLIYLSFYQKPSGA